MKRLPGQYKEKKWQEKGKSLQFVHDRLLQLTLKRNASEITKGELTLLQNNKMSLTSDASISKGAAFSPPVLMACRVQVFETGGENAATTFNVIGVFSGRFYG
ncbi:hypothetical protein [Winslowiella iniecta]|nr:hypothetical protein [Winslowiella iniecta]